MPKGAKADTAVIENAATETADTRSKRQRWREESTVTLTEKGSTNPKKPKSMSAERYDTLLRLCNEAKGQPVTVAALFKAGYRMDDVRHDEAHEFIVLNQPFEI
jgi:hypothetical protein